MKFKSFSLFSSLLLYVAVILFTLGGIRIGETHKKEVFKNLIISGNTYAGLDVDYYDIYAVVGGAGSGYAPATVDGEQTKANFSFSVTVTGKNKPTPKMRYFFGGSGMHIGEGNIVWIPNLSGMLTTPDPSDDGPLGEAELNIYGSMSYWKFDQVYYYIHHHVVKSECPPNDYETMDNSSNVGPQGEPH